MNLDSQSSLLLWQEVCFLPAVCRYMYTVCFCLMSYMRIPINYIKTTALLRRAQSFLAIHLTSFFHKLA